ncbi:MAG: hypothetical protein GPW16_02330 [Euryarchaeota archaeon]|nr:hypothetical protein [Euryarchaeota archaeon]
MGVLLEKNEDFIVGSFDKSFITISSSFYGGGYGRRNGFFILRVSKNFNKNPYVIANNFEKSNNLKNFVGFLTAVNLKDNLFYIDDKKFFLLITLGLGHICIPARGCKKSMTINIVILLKDNVNFACAMDLLNVAISTKVYSLMETGNGVGTPSDSFMISFNEKKEKQFCGFATLNGRELSKRILKLMNMAIKQWNK